MARIVLARRPAPFALPSYSLTGDLLSFLRCGLQYRFMGIGHLPSSEPIQLWFGQFIHGVMEEAFRRYAAGVGPSGAHPVYTELEVDEMIAIVERRLEAQGLRAWEENGRRLGHARAHAAIRELGPSLLPLIHKAEVRLTGSRRLPSQPDGGVDRYEMAGVVDVITHVALRDEALADNRLVWALRQAMGDDLPPEFEVIVDYKGTRRPPSLSGAASLAEQYRWQVQTYAHLRERQGDGPRVVAGVILFLNELHPGAGDVSRLRDEIRRGVAGVVPPPGGEADRILRSARKDATGAGLPLDFRLARAVRVFRVDARSQAAALANFDGVVARIEACRLAERRSGLLVGAWRAEARDDDDGTCAACDVRTFCPTYVKETRPLVPGTA